MHGTQGKRIFIARQAKLEGIVSEIWQSLSSFNSHDVILKSAWTPTSISMVIAIGLAIGVINF